MYRASPPLKTPIRMFISLKCPSKVPRMHMPWSLNSLLSSLFYMAFFILIFNALVPQLSSLLQYMKFTTAGSSPLLVLSRLALRASPLVLALQALALAAFRRVLLLCSVTHVCYRAVRYMRVVSLSGCTMVWC